MSLRSPRWPRPPEGSSVDGAASVTRGCRPGSTTPVASGRCSTPRSHRACRRTRGRSRVEGLVESPTTWTWDEIHALPADSYQGAIHCVTTWSKFDMDVRRRLRRHAARGRPAAAGGTHVMAFSHTGYTTNLPLADVTGGKAWVVWEVDGEPLPGRPRRPGAAARAPPVLLEERQVGGRAAPARPRRAGLLGAQRVPRPRRPVARAALPGRLMATADSPWRMATVVGDRRRDAQRQDVPAALPEPSHHRAGQHVVVRLTAPDGYTASALVLGGVGARRQQRDRAHRRAARGRRGVGVPPRRRRARRRARGPRAARRLVRVGRRHAGAARRRRLRCRAADGDAALARRTGRSDLVRVVVSVRSPDDLYYAAELPGPETTLVYSRVAPPDSLRPPGRLTAADLPWPLARTRRRTSAVPPASATPPATSSSASACRSSTSVSSASARPADSIRVFEAIRVCGARTPALQHSDGYVAGDAT